MSTVITEKTLKRIINEVLSRLMSDDASLPVDNGVGDVESPNDEFNDIGDSSAIEITRGKDIKDKEGNNLIEYGDLSYPAFSVPAAKKLFNIFLKHDGLTTPTINDAYKSGFFKKWFAIGSVPGKQYNIGQLFEFILGNNPNNDIGSDVLDGTEIKAYQEYAKKIELFQLKPEKIEYGNASDTTLQILGTDGEYKTIKDLFNAFNRNRFGNTKASYQNATKSLTKQKKKITYTASAVTEVNETTNTKEITQIVITTSFATGKIIKFYYTIDMASIKDIARGDKSLMGRLINKISSLLDVTTTKIHLTNGILCDNIFYNDFFTVNSLHLYTTTNKTIFLQKFINAINRGDIYIVYVLKDNNVECHFKANRNVFSGLYEKHQDLIVTQNTEKTDFVNNSSE